MKAVSLVGGTSFLATSIAKQFELGKWNVNIHQRQIGQNTSKRTYFGYNYPADPLNIELLASSDVVIFCAGAGISVDKIVDDIDIYTMNLFEPIHCIEGLKKIGFSGTVIMFGSYFEIGQNSEKVLVTEDGLLSSHLNPINTYSISKRLLTKFIESSLHDLNFNLLHFILPNVFGENESKERLIPYIIKSIIDAKEILLGSPRVVRQYLSVEEIAEFILLVCQNQSFKSGIYNLNGPQELSTEDVFSICLMEAQKNDYEAPNVRYGKSRRADNSANFLGLNGMKAKRNFGWDPKLTIETQLGDYFKRYE